jgi:hypothetical protein
LSNKKCLTISTKTTLLLTTIFLITCANYSEKTVLEGVWKSNLELTVSNYKENKKLTPEIKQFLANNLGKIFVSFRNNKVKVFFDGLPEHEAEDQTFKVLLNTKEFVEIEIQHDAFNNKTHRYYKSNDCIYITQKEYGYNEYFCKVKP